MAGGSKRGGYEGTMWVGGSKEKKKTSGGFQGSNQTIGPLDFMNTDLEVYNNMRLRQSFQSESLG
jgi:hypothetical protein